MYEVFCNDFQAHIWHILPRKRGFRGWKPQYVCDLGESSQGALLSLMHMHLRVDCAKHGDARGELMEILEVWLIMYSVEFTKVNANNKSDPRTEPIADHKESSMDI